ncbi:helix-turn-helix domain-containing protein [Chitinophaga pendula]|uniref:helix-turn-helix domain-containing protein n=1 Tax=Chitinophaga TaxID=79328 RepID=UPI000BB081B2|nr:MULTISPECIES: helix-turn-helix domain-containing protein [Chitinophaga]ASZ12582.1 hypothetical protein CK934_17280 [Chitinophaga sp. MD30]UCJ09815.1 helix-turn-helix domain-containing protein [Chitinophaga pendula]
MKKIVDVSAFYENYLDGKSIEKNNFLGYFDTFSWQHFKADISACDRIQRKPFYKIALLTGEAVYHSNNQHIPIKGNTIVFIDPMTQCRFKTNDKRFTGKYCVFSESFLRGTSKIILANWPVFKTKGIYTKSLNDEEYKKMMSIFQEIETEYQTAYTFKEDLIRNRIFDIIHFTQKMEQQDTSAINKQNESLASFFFSTLEAVFLHISVDNPLPDKTPAYFAQLLNTTVDRLNKTLKRSTGKTTQALLHERLLLEANVLLRHTAYSMKEIAWCLQFQEVAHFQNFYKKHTGRTPLQYRLA